MLKFCLIHFIILSSCYCSAQKIIVAAMADEKGITNDQKKAKYLIIIKKYSDTAYERLDYNFSGSMLKRALYIDSSLSILNGNYAEYSPAGFLSSDGQYLNNKKDGDWFLFDDTSRAIAKYVYHLDTLLSVVNLDSLDEERKKMKGDTTDQHEAVYNGAKKVLKIIQSNIKVPERTIGLGTSGTTRIKFIIDTTGKAVDIEVFKSVEFAFDEEAMRVVGLLKDWIPASQRGIKLKAYRILPITISF